MHQDQVPPSLWLGIKQTIHTGPGASAWNYFLAVSFRIWIHDDNMGEETHLPPELSLQGL